MVSEKVKAILTLSGKKQVELAAHFGMTGQSMNNKMNRDSWSAKDLISAADFCGCKLAFVLPNGERLVFDSTECYE